ncbi:MAG: hypothetical protein P8Y94_08420 [Acidobacteriota bacterium]
MKATVPVQGSALAIAVLIGITAFAAPLAGAAVEKVDLSAATRQVNNRHVATLVEGERSGIRLDEAAGDGIVWFPATRLANGTIELDIRGRDLMGRSFVGVAFHGVDAETFDAVYFRPFNFHSPDPARRAHSVQYIAHPTYTWSKLRSEHPGQYEKRIESAPQPNGWFHARIVVAHPKVSVFVNGATEPSLVVDQLNDRGEGWVGVWVGNGSNGDFANLSIQPAP